MRIKEGKTYEEKHSEENSGSRGNCSGGHHRYCDKKPYNAK